MRLLAEVGGELSRLGCVQSTLRFARQTTRELLTETLQVLTVDQFAGPVLCEALSFEFHCGQ